MENPPLVSILVNNYNYAKFLGEAIDSAINQTYPHVEVVVVDDGSTDNSQEIIAGYGERIIPVFQENAGQAAAFNTGFAASKGEIICFLDSDDVFDAEKAAEITRVFREYPYVDWCFHSLKLIDKNTNRLLGQSQESSSKVCDFRKQIRNGKLPFLAPATSGLCFRRSLLEEIIPLAEELKPGPDRYLVNIAPILSQGFFLDKQLAIQGIHNSNVNTFKEGKVFEIRRGERHVLVAYYLSLKFPRLKRFTNRIFARGVSFYWHKFTPDKSFQENIFIKKYWKSLSWIDKLEVLLIMIYHLVTKPVRRRILTSS